jgi:hypothetical protein
MTALHEEALAFDANNRGKVGGAIVLESDKLQAALFTRAEVKPIPPLSDEVSSAVLLLTDSGIAFVESVGSDSDVSHYLTRRRQVTTLDFGSDPASQFDINDRGIVSGTSDRPDSDRAFRYNPFSGRFTLLEPLPTEPDSWGQAINNRGHVLGYSFVPGGLERIGVWRGTKFHTYFVEGTPEVPTVSNSLLWNERGLIVITDVRRPDNDLSSYLVPWPGVRLNLADLTDGPLPPWTLIVDINNRGDLIGVGGDSRFDISSVFLLRRAWGANREADHIVNEVASSVRSAAAAVGAGVRLNPTLERVLHQRLFGGLGKNQSEDGVDPADD